MKSKWSDKFAQAFRNKKKMKLLVKAGKSLSVFSESMRFNKNEYIKVIIRVGMCEKSIYLD